jgi:hypothetical protein
LLAMACTSFCTSLLPAEIRFHKSECVPVKLVSEFFLLALAGFELTALKLQSLRRPVSLSAF